jgi:hypothetical protein
VNRALLAMVLRQRRRFTESNYAWMSGSSRDGPGNGADYLGIFGAFAITLRRVIGDILLSVNRANIASASEADIEQI